MKKQTLLKTIMMMVVIVWAHSVWAQGSRQIHIGSAGNEVATRVKVLPDGSGTVIGGYTYDYVPGSGDIHNAQIILMKVNPAGNHIIWQKKMGIAGKNNILENMIITHDGNIVIVGSLGRNAVYQDNTAALMKFKSADGSLMWDFNFQNPAHTAGGEIFTGITELGAGANYALMAVGITDFRPGGSHGMICMFDQFGSFLYEETHHVKFASGGSGFMGVCTSADGLSGYIVGSFFGTSSGDAQVHMYTPFTPTPASGTMVWDKYYDFTMHGVIAATKDTAQPWNLSLDNNFFSNVYLQGTKLLIEGTSLAGFSVGGGYGESIVRLNAADGSVPELWQIQNSNVAYCNTSMFVPVSDNHIYNVQSPGGAFIDPVLHLTGTSSNTIVTDVTTLTPIMSAPATAKFTTPGGAGIHALLDITIAGSNLHMAGSTTDPNSYGANDIYYVTTPTTLPIDSPCNKPDIAGLVVYTVTPQARELEEFTFVPATIHIPQENTDYQIGLLCGEACADSTEMSIIKTTDARGNTVVTATAHVSTIHSIVAYKWSGSGAAVTHRSRADKDSYTFTAAAGTTTNVTATVYIIDTSLIDTNKGPCCEVVLTDTVVAPQPCHCFSQAQSTLTYFGSTSAQGCQIQLTATAGLTQGCTMIGYTWQTGTITYPFSPSSFTTNIRNILVPLGTSATVTVTMYAVDANGETCTVVRSVVINCTEGSASPVGMPAGKPNDESAEYSILSTGMMWYAQDQEAVAVTVDNSKQLPNNIYIFPNPTSNTVSINSPNEEIKTVEIIDINGKKVGKYTYDHTTSTKISMEQLTPGVYLFRVNNTMSKMVTKSE